jgi:hypothetical protein
MRKLWVLLLAGTLLVAACGDDGGNGESGAGADQAGEEAAPEPRTCELLTGEEVEEATGLPVRDTRADARQPGRDRCSWFLGEEQVDTLHVIVHDEDAGRALFEGDLGGEQVEGLGDQARWVPDLSTLYVRVDGAGAVMVQLVVEPAPEEPLTVARQLAQLAVDRL